MAALTAPLPFAADERGAARLSRGQTAAIGFSLAVHAALIGYLAYQKWTPAIEQIIDVPPSVVVQTWRPEPKVVKADPRPAQVKIHQPALTSVAPIDSIPVNVTPGDIDVWEVPTDFTLGGEDDGTGFEVATAAPPIPVIGRPDWIKKPGAKEFARHFPERAIRTGTSGAATLDCRVAADGHVNSCRVVDETPMDYEFGSAAIKLSKYFVMRPRTEDGRPVDGAAVRIPLRFELGDD